MNFLMSGKSDVLDAISALAAAGYESVHLPWGGGYPETLLSVLGEADPRDGRGRHRDRAPHRPNAVKV